MKPYRTDVEYDMSEEYPDLQITGIYKAVSYHRNGTQDKSQWKVSVDEEIDLFAYSKAHNQTLDGKGHGLFIINNSPAVVGLTVNLSETKLARFEDGNHNDSWHGYPANYLKSKNDIPPTPILQDWLRKQWISKADMNRLRMQKPCSLQKSV